MMRHQWRPAIVSFILLTLLTGIIYPLSVTLVAHIFFKGKATGSLIRQEGKLVGSLLIGQAFTDPQYFWGRLSATALVPYNAAASSGSNYGPLHPALVEAAKKRVHDLRNFDPENSNPIPVDLVTSSASGLDPHIGLASALYQARRVGPCTKIARSARV